MKIIAIKEMSAGNETVGQSWNETKIFDSEKDKLIDVMLWADSTRVKVILTVPANDYEEYERLKTKEFKF